MAIYSTGVAIIACSPVALSLLLYHFPMSITLLPPFVTPSSQLRLYRRLPFPPQGSLRHVLRELEGGVDARGGHDSHWH